MRGRHRYGALVLVCALALAGCGAVPAAPVRPSTVPPQDITLWLVGSTTPQSLRDYLVTQYRSLNGGTLTIEEQTWSRLTTRLGTAVLDPVNTPDVTEIGSTQSPSYTWLGEFSDLTDLYAELGGDKLLPALVQDGAVNGRNYTLPYFAVPRYVFYRKDLWAAAGLTAPPATLAEFDQDVVALAQQNPRGIEGFSGFLIGTQDWRTALTWVYAYGGALARQSPDGQWVSTMSDLATLRGLKELQSIEVGAALAPAGTKNPTPWLYLNDTDVVKATDGSTTPATLATATILATDSVRPLLGDLVKNAAGTEVRQWNDDVFGAFPLPGLDGGPAPMVLTGSNIGIPAASRHQEAARQLLRIIFSPTYQTMLAQVGLGPANADYRAALGSDQYAQAQIAALSAAQLVPAAPGWANVEASGKLEDFFQKVADGGDVALLAAELDLVLTPLLNTRP